MTHHKRRRKEALEQTEAQRRNAACDELTELLGPPPDVYLKSTDWAPSAGPTEPKPMPAWPDSLPVVDFDGSDEALEDDTFWHGYDWVGKL